MAEIVWLYDILDHQVAALPDPAGLEVEDRLQDAEVLRFTVRADDPKADYLEVDRMVRYNGRRYRVTELGAARQGPAAVWNVAADALWIDLLGFPVPANIVGKSRADGLDWILDGTGWTRGDVEAEGGNFSLDTSQDDTVLALLRAWAVMVDRELVFDTDAKTVSLAVQQGVDNGMRFRYGRNLVSISRKAEPPTCTRLYPVGADDLTVTSVNPTGKPYIDNFDFYTDQGLTLAEAQARYLKVQRWEDNRYLLALNLFDAGTRRLAALAVPRVSYQLAVADLTAITGVDETVGIGDTCRVYDAPTGISLSTRVVRRLYRPLQPQQSIIELGYLEQSLPTQQTTTTAAAGPPVTFLVDTNSSALTITGGLIILCGISLGVDPSSIANTIIGLNLDCTATGTGTAEVTWWYGATQVGPTTKVDFAAGALHIAVPDYFVGISTSNRLTAKLRVSSGTGKITVAPGGADMYVMGTGLAGGGVSGVQTITIAEPVATRTGDATDGGATTLLLTPIDVEGVESVDTTPGEVGSETVTAVTT